MTERRVVRRKVAGATKGPRREKEHTAPPPFPRITRLLALAIYFDDLIRRGEVKDYAEIARIGRVSRARVTQIMDLLNLAPAVQEDLLLRPASDASERAQRSTLQCRIW